MTEPKIITLGCRLNAHESDTASAHARAAGLADSVIVNTCAVTTEAVRQARQTIRRLKREKPEARIIVTGCAVQLNADRFAAMPEIDAVIGNREKLEAETFVAIARANDQFVRVGEIAKTRAVAVPPPPSFSQGRTRAILTVQNGCDHRCTFCIIPFARGPARSMTAGEAVKCVRDFVAGGHREVVLTGVDLTSYGTDLKDRAPLGRLVRTILREVPELPRLRLSSIDPAEVDNDLLQALAEEPRLMPYLHLSLQSGDDMVLKRMKRRHTRQGAIRFTEALREARPDIVLGADLIAGFPTETDDMFQTTLDTIAACGLTYLHIFPYSARPGTPASRMPQVPGEIVVARAARLRQEGRVRLEAFLRTEVGSVRTVLMERGGTGRTPQFAEVAVNAAPDAGAIMDVRIIGQDGTRLVGECVAAIGAPTRKRLGTQGIKVTV